MRLFIAINFNTDTRERLITLREELRSHSQRGNFSRDDNLHLTLAFLGECDAKQTAEAKAVVTAFSFAPFNVTVDRVGRFKRDGGDIWWTGLREDKPLMSLQRDLSERLRLAGFTLETRKYSPHIALGREVISSYSISKIDPFGEVIESIELMKSERISDKLTYTAIAGSRLNYSD